MVQLNISGIVAPVFTPVGSDSAINYQVIPEYVKYLAEEGIAAILVCGTSGEASCFTVGERKLLAEAWMTDARAHDIKVIVQVGGAPLPDVLEMAKHAEKIGADAILSLPELYFKPRTAEQLVDYLELVSGAAPSLPILYYHFPMMSGVDVNMKQFFKLASSKIPNFAGMKADLGVALQVTEHLTEDKTIFMANHILAPAALMGYECSIATVTNIFPKLVKELLDAVKIGEVDKTRMLQKKLNRLVDEIGAHGDWVPTMKVAMELVTGVRVGAPRLPLKPVSDAAKINIRQVLMSNNIAIVE